LSSEDSSSLSLASPVGTASATALFPLVSVPVTSNTIPGASIVVDNDLAFDHFLCYKAKTTKETPKFVRRKVTLDDQFENGEFTIRKPAGLCNPVDKNGEGIGDPDTHLKGYKIKEARGEPKHVKQTNVQVDNQFGE
jgi:hypothetical protein